MLGSHPKMEALRRRSNMDTAGSSRQHGEVNAAGSGFRRQDLCCDATIICTAGRGKLCCEGTTWNAGRTHQYPSWRVHGEDMHVSLIEQGHDDVCNDAKATQQPRTQNKHS
jgi:hypothetical protein